MRSLFSNGWHCLEYDVSKDEEVTAQTDYSKSFKDFSNFFAVEGMRRLENSLQNPKSPNAKICISRDGLRSFGLLDAVIYQPDGMCWGLCAHGLGSKALLATAGNVSMTRRYTRRLTKRGTYTQYTTDVDARLG